jgi:hypothetical protein
MHNVAKESQPEQVVPRTQEMEDPPAFAQLVAPDTVAWLAQPLLKTNFRVRLEKKPHL